jgi:diaminohydroxyphosphoribosylaminopyrimidine deaminase/5-amino-6-(5-phosphoribosylamino)uracil reductase
LYVTLEPCSTQGRTPPCTTAIIRAGFKRAIVGATDPNPAHAGRGLKLLRQAGVEVIPGVIAEECADLNLIFNYWIAQTRPLFAGKVATTLDGRVGTRARQSKWITGPAARRDAMRWRRLFPAVGVGAGTVLADDPQLTSRIGRNVWCPMRLIFDRTLRTVAKKLPRVYTDDFRVRTIVVTASSPDQARRAMLEKQGVELWALPAKNWFTALRQQCLTAGLTGLFLEGGPTLLSAFLHAEALDYLLAYRAPKFLADAEAVPVFTGPARPRLADAFALSNVRQAALGDDQLLRGFVQYP